ncbi:response regulator transcription factor [Rugamonas sp. CCM 8940]|nr:response regulator transcription factor [Rugamonas sp. CCM 8940]
MLTHSKDGVPPADSRSAIASVLLVDDDIGLGQMLIEYLAGEMIQLQTVQDGWMAHELLRAPDHGFELLLLDVTLPGQSGFDILRRLRQNSALPVIMMTARASEADRIAGLELGADDYLPKPFSPRELLARMRAVLRRNGGAAIRQAPMPSAGAAPAPELLQVGALSYPAHGLEVRVDSGVVRLTSVEARLLKILMRSAGHMIGREQLTLWALGRKLQPQDRSLDTHVSNLRRKLGLTANAQGLPELRSVRGLGYLLTATCGAAA